MKVKSESEVAQSCPTLCDPIDGSPPGSSVHWILQARVLEWDAIAFSDIHTTKFKIITNKDLPYSTGNYLIFFNNLNGMGFPIGSAEKAMAPHSSTLAWKIPWTEEPGRLQSMGSRRVGYN